MVREYVEEGRSAKQIAKRLGCSHSTVLKRLRAAGIAIRESTKTYHRGQLGIGEVMYRGKKIKSKDEQQVVRRIGSLQGKGLSYHAIAALLNDEGIHTKNKKSRWYAATVMNIVKTLGKRSTTDVQPSNTQR